MLKASQPTAVATFCRKKAKILLAQKTVVAAGRKLPGEV
jgi:hypothetical protein